MASLSNLAKILLLIVLVLAPAYAITNCITIAAPGAYVLENSITNTAVAKCINITVSNVALDGQGYAIDGVDAANSYGIYVYNSSAALTNVSIRNVTASDWDYGIYYNAQNGSVTNSHVFSDVTYGLYVSSSPGNNFTDNILENNSAYDLNIAPISLSDCDNIIENNTGTGGLPILFYNYSATIENIAATEILLCDADGSTMRNVTIIGSQTLQNNVLSLMYTDNAVIDGLTAVNTYYGFSLSLYVNKNISISNVFASGTKFGGGLAGANDSLVRNVTIVNSSMRGMSLSREAYNNVLDGITIINGSSLFSGSDMDIRTIAGFTPQNNTIRNVVVRKTTNYLRHDNLTVSQIPNVFVNLTFCKDETSIGCITWGYLNISYAYINTTSNLKIESDFVSMNDSNIKAIQFNKSANITLYTADCAYIIFRKAGFPASRADITANGSVYSPLSRSCSNNTLRFDVSGFSGYSAGSEHAIRNCTMISTPGSYVLENSITNTAVAQCINITVSNVALNGQGFTVDGVDTASGAYGIYAYNSTSTLNNITIGNITITDFSKGIYATSVRNSSILNCTVASNVQEGLFVEYSAGIIVSSVISENNTGSALSYSGIRFAYVNSSSISNSRLKGNTRYGILVYPGYDINVTDSVVMDNGRDGIDYWVVDKGSVTGNNVTNVSWYGFGMYTISNLTMYGNRITSNTLGGAYINANSVSNSFSGNLVSSNGGYGLSIYQASTGNTFENNTVSNNIGPGFIMNSSGVANSLDMFRNNLVSNNTRCGFNITTAGGATFENNAAYNNTLSGFCVYHSSGNSFTNNSAYSSTNGFYLYNSSSNALTNNTAYSNTFEGFTIKSGLNNTLTNNTAYGNSEYGFYLESSSNNILSGNTAYNHTSYNGFQLYSAWNNTFTSNTAYGNMRGFRITTSSTGNNLTSNTIYGNSDYGVSISSNSIGNTFTNTLIYNQSYYLFQQATAASPNNFTNLTIRYSPTMGLINYPFISTTSLNLNSSNMILSPYFVSINSLAMPELNKSARITLWTPSCSSPTIYMLEGFPTTRDEVLQNGTVCTECIIISCTGNTIVFDVPHFSGYAAGGETGLTITNDGPKYSYEEITFTANYVNTTDASHIPGADCNLSLWNGSTYTMSEAVDHYELSLNVTDIGAHSYNVTCSKAGFTTLTALDTFTIFYNGTASLVDLYGANVTVGSTGRYVYNASSDNVTSEGGNVSEVNLTSNASTDRWAGFYGNISGSILLAQDVNVQPMYDWAWNSSSGGVVCASTGPTTLSSIMGATYADIDTAWSFSPNVTDSAANTFNNSNCSQSFGATTVANAYYADTGYSGGFTTCAWKSIFTPSKAEMLFCTNITYDGPLFNGETGDFEVMVPTAYGTGVYETYYFYASLG